MPREQKEKEIDGQIYQVTQTNAFKALKMQTKLIKILGPGLFSFVGSQGLTGVMSLLDETNNDKSAASKLLPILIENFDDEEANTLITLLFEKGVFLKDGDASVPLDFEEHFIGKPLTLWKVAWFVVETNFAMGELLKSDLSTTEKEDQIAES